MTPAKALLPLLLIATLQIPAVLNPFGLERRSEMDRYRLFPAPYWKLLMQKHLALAALFHASAVPLAAALACRMSLPEICATAIQFCLVLMSLLLMGTILMRTPSARWIRISFGSISGSNMPLTLVVEAVLLLALVPVAGAIAIRGTAPITACFIALGILTGVIAAYVLLIRRQLWPTVAE